MAASNTSSGNPVLDHPGIVATLVAIAVLGGFLFALYNAATSHPAGHGGSHEAPHGAAPAAETAHH